MPDIAIRAALLPLLPLLLMLVLTAPASGQTEGLDNPGTVRTALSMGLFPPDMIMRHQQALGITVEQRRSMLDLVRTFQSDVAELQWTLANEQQKLRDLLAQDDIDPAQITPTLERVMKMESEFKLAHFRLLIAIRAELTAEQIATIKRRLRQRRS